MAEKACKMFVLSNITSMEQTSAVLEIILNFLKLFFKLMLHDLFLNLFFLGGGSNIYFKQVYCFMFCSILISDSQIFVRNQIYSGPGLKMCQTPATQCHRCCLLL